MSTVRERLLLPTLLLATATSAITSSLGAPLVPQVAAAEGVSLATAQWTLTAPLLSGAIVAPVLGRLGAHRNRRPVLVVAVAVALLGTLIAALPLGFVGIMVGRTLQGFALAAGPVALAIARDVVPEPRRASALSLLSVAIAAGNGLGYPIAAFFVTVGGLSAAYWFGFAVNLATLVLAVAVIPPGGGDEPEPRVDWPGAVMLSIGSSALFLTVTQGQQWGWASPLFIGVTLVAVLALVAWGRRSLRVPNPLIDLRLAVRQGVLAPNLIGLIVGMGTYLLLTLVVVVVQAPEVNGGFGQSVLFAGLLMVPYSIASFAGSRMNLLLERRVPAQMLLPIASAINAVGLAVIAVGHTQLAAIIVAMVLGGLGGGAAFAAMPGLVFRHAERQESGSAMAANQLMRSFGFAAGSAAAATILALFVPPGDTHPDPVAFVVVGLVATVLLAVGFVVSLVLGLREIRATRAASDR
jgi:predicted MFS family arabinose efflux permease